MPLPAAKILILLAGLIATMAGPGHAQQVDGIAESLSERVLFVTSGGYWEETVTPVQGEAGAPPPTAAETADPDAPESPSEAATRRGYYRLIAIRGADNRSQVHLQQVALSAEGPELALSIEVEEINALGAYVTDIRPEDSTGAALQPGFAAYIHLKTDPAEVEPETWTLFVDELGDIVVEKSSN